MNDFTDVLGREFDELFATYSDLGTTSSQSAVEEGSRGAGEQTQTKKPEKIACSENLSEME